jgi:hypothetical protein
VCVSKIKTTTDNKNGRTERALMPFWPAAVDEAGLDVYTSRLLAHVIRAAGKSGEYYEARPRAATTCGMSPRRVHTSLSDLVRMSVLAVKDAPSKGRTPTRYVLLPPDQWKLNRAPRTRLNHAPATRLEASTVHGRDAQPCTDEEINRAPRANKRFSIRQGTQTEKVLKETPSAVEDTTVVKADAIEILDSGQWPSNWKGQARDKWRPHGAVDDRDLESLRGLLGRPFEDVMRGLSAFLAAGNARFKLKTFVSSAGDWINGQTGRTTSKGQQTDNWARRVMGEGGGR